MKIVIASDLHGSAQAVRALDLRIKAESPDYIFLLGDLLYHGPRNSLPPDYDTMCCAEILNSYAEKIVCVRGNCDAEVDQWVLDFSIRDDVAYFFDEETGVNFVLSHGHRPGLIASEPLESMPEHCAFLSGHTHVKQLEMKAGVLLVNPGSTSIPKDGCASYATYDAGRFALKNLDGEVLKEFDYS